MSSHVFAFLPGTVQARTNLNPNQGNNKTSLPLLVRAEGKNLSQ